LKQEDVQNAFIFCNRKRDVDDVAKWLKSKGYAAEAMHGDMPQARRTETLQNFKDETINVLVCSDVAARGIDVKNVSHVFNYDVPMHPDDYVHRIGRTGRAGQKGRAWMMTTDRDEKFLDAIEKLIKKKFDVTQVLASKSGNSKPSEKKKEYTSSYAEKPVTQQKAKKPNKGQATKSSYHPNDADLDDGTVGFGDDIPAFLK